MRMRRKNGAYIEAEGRERGGSMRAGRLKTRRYKVRRSGRGAALVLLLLTIGLRVGRLGDLLRHDGLTTVLLEGKATY